MVYIEVWDDFYQAAHQLYVEAPARTRYSMKYRHSEGKLVLKVTDDRTCIKYRTNQKEQLKEVEKLNTLFFRLMTSKNPESVSAVHEPVASEAAPGEAGGHGAPSEKARKKKSRK
eukprot:TRINITY_DN9545_c0_g1_i1.p1 TRINITY_DN9545_c0_g1~~TRINITY_DN9545_c0_g1_i1.p1  ORF type:complete len:115 (-),score=28.04 TRINITY_DN9545_c0_g1_i1:213-557(-)